MILPYELKTESSTYMSSSSSPHRMHLHLHTVNQAQKMCKRRLGLTGRAVKHVNAPRQANRHVAILEAVHKSAQHKR